jgi:rRNA maturation endonuclease Nob1
MQKNNGIPHQFNLSGMAAGDWFLGCRTCWFQLSKKTAAKPVCPKCGDRLSHLTVASDDIDV